LKSQIDEIEGKMNELKVILKAKFKNQINLDPQEE